MNEYTRNSIQVLHLPCFIQADGCHGFRFQRQEELEYENETLKEEIKILEDSAVSVVGKIIHCQYVILCSRVMVSFRQMLHLTADSRPVRPTPYVICLCSIFEEIILLSLKALKGL